jgi:hypothetical protein
VAAYPPKTLALVRRWIDSGLTKRVVCTVKFQGEIDHDTSDAFAAIPGGTLQHLWHNKHELTFTWFDPRLSENGDLGLRATGPVACEELGGVSGGVCCSCC